jgi:Cu/Ag efflux protein CusF
MSTRRIAALIAALTCALFVSIAVYAPAPGAKPASLLSVDVQAQTPPAGKKEHAFKGKVEKVDEKGKLVTVNNENVPGWMPSMTMSYKVDKEAVLKNLKAGDNITATVYDGDFQTLYNIKVAPPAKK